MDRLLFTPRTLSGERLQLHVSPQDSRKSRRGKHWKALVTDLDSGLAYLCRGASCGLPRCFCDALVVEIYPSLSDVPEDLQQRLARSEYRYRASGHGLHDRFTRGETLTQRERLRLERWYQERDAAQAVVM
ncbi:hypothetical protein [Armatimonas rosea]|uniref:Uncharacterized protein n=1 Tax=Armatimonas rosea TaxID=685828 RepID=A0A7W9SR83_ARMRO|nr:hypothetical protein [Armatimonas rosea]MBB6050724.1 hypothetical protein [Armatimonas rosea]